MIARDIITTIIFIVLICIICFVNENIDRLNLAEENRILQNMEIMLLQKDISRLDVGLIRNETKTEVLKNKEIILMNRDLLEKFERDVEAFESVIKNHQERMGK